MSTATPAPPVVSPPEAAPRRTPRKSGRRRHALWLASLATILLLAGFGVRYLATYRPLVTGNYGQGPVFVAGSNGRDRVVFLPGARVRWGMSIRNDGKLPVTVTGVRSVLGEPFASSAVLISRKPDLAVTHSVGPLEAFHPFSLAPGQQRMIEYEGMFAGCPTASTGSEHTYKTFTVTYRTLGFSHTVDISGSPGSGFRLRVPGPSCRGR